MDKIKLPPQRLEAAFAATEADRDSRVVPITWYSGATVEQFSFQNGLHLLKLSTDPQHIRMGALNGGSAPFTKGHRSANDPDGVIGVIENASMEGGKGRAAVRFSKRPDVEPVYQDVLDGVLRNVSLEASVYKMKELPQDGAKIRTFLAVDWEPYAVALVARGADPDAHVAMSAEAECSECEIEFAAAVRATSPEEQAMEKPIENAGEQARAVDEAKLAAQAAERTRVLEINKIASTGKLEAKFAAEHVEKGTSVDEFRKLAFEALAARSAENPTESHRVQFTRDAGETRVVAFREALMHRAGLMNLTDKNPGYEVRNLAHQGMLRLAAECVRAAGKNPDHMAPVEIAQFAMHSTSDFPLILGTTADASLRAGYGKAPSDWQKIAARRTAANFKSQYELMFDMQAAFPQVPESGEYKAGTLVEGRESWKVLTYGQVIRVTRQVIINDDLGAITNIPEQMGVKAGLKQASLVWGVLTANGVLSDGVALFAAAATRGADATGNLITGAGTAISIDSMGLMRKKLALQKDLGGDTIGLTPKYMVVPATKEQIARQYTSEKYMPTAQGSTNPWTGMVELIVEPRLDATSTTAWYFFADPAVAPVLIYAYLAGNEGIFSQTETTLDVDGVKWLARMDFGCGAIDFRGAQKNDGA